MCRWHDLCERVGYLRFRNAVLNVKHVPLKLFMDRGQVYAVYTICSPEFGTVSGLHDGYRGLIVLLNVDQNSIFK